MLPQPGQPGEDIGHHVGSWRWLCKGAPAAAGAVGGKKEKKKKDKLGGGSKGNVVAERLRESSESTLVRYCVCVASKHCGVLL